MSKRKKVKKGLDHVVTCDYIRVMKEKKTPWGQEQSESMMLKETATLPGIGLAIPVRAAKAKLSALLDLVAQGQQVTITSDGQPKAILLPVHAGHGRKPFRGMGTFLSQQPLHSGPTAEDVVREDRDSRGW